MSAAALRALHVPGDPLILPNAWDAATARVVAAAGFPAVATTSSGVAEALGHEDGEQTPVDEMLAAVARIARAVDVPVTADLEAGYGLDGGELARRLLEAGADCVYPIGVADEATIAAFVETGVPVNVLLRPGAPPVARLAELGVARISLGHFLHAEMMDALSKRLSSLDTRS